MLIALFFVLQVVEVSTSKTGKHGHAKCHFVGIDIFNGKKLEDIVPSSHNCDVCAVLWLKLWNYIFYALYSLFQFTRVTQVPHVNRVDYQLIDISEDGFVSVDYSLLLSFWHCEVQYLIYLLHFRSAFSLIMEKLRMTWGSQPMKVCLNR